MTECDPAILDLAYLRAQTAGDSALERELLGLLDGQCTELLPLLTSFDDEEGRRNAAHSLRGAAAGLGARGLAAAAAAVEEGRAPAAVIENAVAEIRPVIARLLARGGA